MFHAEENDAEESDRLMPGASWLVNIMDAQGKVAHPSGHASCALGTLQTSFYVSLYLHPFSNNKL